MTRICIVTPGQLASNPRAVKEATSLSRAGHQVTVVCSKVLDRLEPLDRSVMATANFEVRRLNLESRRFRGRVRRLRQIAARALFRLLPRLRIAEFAHSAMTPQLLRAASAVPADLYIAHYVAALPAAARAAARHGARYAFDAEDFHLGDLPDEPRNGHDKRLIAAVEQRYLPGAAFVTAASPLIARAYAETYRLAEPAVLLNVFPRPTAPASAGPRGVIEPGPSLYWFSQTVGPGRGLEIAIEAIARTRSRPHLYLRGAPTAGYEAVLRMLAERCGIADRLHFLAPSLPGELEREGARFDVGYCGELSNTRNRQLALTNKLFSYLASGLAIVASDVLAHCAIAPELELALRLFEEESPSSLAAALDGFLMNPERLARARRASWQLAAERFNWDFEQARLLDLVERVTL